MKLKARFKWYVWIGFFWDKECHWLYFFPLPTLGIILKFSPKTYNIIKSNGYWFITGGSKIISAPQKKERSAYVGAWNRWKIDNSRL